VPVCSSASCVTWTARVKSVLENQTVTCARCDLSSLFVRLHIIHSDTQSGRFLVSKSVGLYMNISQESDVQTLPNFLCMLPVAMVWSSSASVAIHGFLCTF